LNSRRRAVLSQLFQVSVPRDLLAARSTLMMRYFMIFPFENLNIVPLVAACRSIWWLSSKPYYAVVLLRPSLLGALPPLGRDSGDSCCLYLGLAQVCLTAIKLAVFSTLCPLLLISI